MIDYAITSNAIRSMWEMESESHYLKGNIASIINICFIYYI